MLPDAMLQAMDARVDAIPYGGWLDPRARDVFRRAGRRLLDSGWGEEEVARFLDELLDAASDDTIVHLRETGEWLNGRPKPTMGTRY